MLGDPSKIAQNAAPPKGKAADMDLTGLVMEPKLDGFRLLVYRGPHGVDTFTRTGKSQKGKLPHLEAALSALPENTWLDGEICSLDADGLPEWGQVQSKMGSNAGDPTGSLTYVVFDILTYDGLDVRPLPLAERRMALKVVTRTVDRLILSAQRPATHAYHDALVEQGHEGTIVKDPTMPYASGKRGHGWTKFKANDEMDVVIMGYKPGENSFTGMVGAIIFGQYQDCPRCKGDATAFCADRARMSGACQSGKVLVERGRCSGMDMKMRQQITNDQPGHLGKVISLAYMGIMPSGSPRHPQYKRFRTDKLATDCEWT